MIVKADEIISVLKDDPDIERDDSPPFSEYVGYREKDGSQWFILDESKSEIETDFLLEDLVSTENYLIAAKVKKYVDLQKAKKPKTK